MSETVTLTLTEFLLARIDEDAEAARAVTARNLGEVDDAGRWEFIDIEYEGSFPTPPGGDGYYPLSTEPWAKLATRYDPARVLAESDAKRRIVGQLTRNVRDIPDGWIDQIGCLLALPYADHPDYHEEWKP